MKKNNLSDPADAGLNCDGCTFRAHNQYLLLQGEVDAPEVIVSSKAKGRVVERLIERGDDVKQGQALIRLTSPELEAQVASLVAARDQAQAQLTESLNGTREESVRNYAAQLAKSQAELANAQRDFQRMSSMAGKGYVSKTELDQSRRARDVAQQGVLAAKAQLDRAKTATAPSSVSVTKRHFAGQNRNWRS